jgi:hypothetical protein
VTLTQTAPDNESGESCFPEYSRYNGTYWDRTVTFASGEHGVERERPDDGLHPIGPTCFRFARGLPNGYELWQSGVGEVHLAGIEMAKRNCWEFKKCGRDRPRGNGAEADICPARTDTRLNGMNSGTNGGRACWAVAGTYCGHTAQGKFAAKLEDCAVCDFFFSVMREEGPNFSTVEEILARLHF